ncbi:MAG: endonuclease domain-containing protein [Xanthomonadales bacterium]|nr:endonuclease domain-containing protein [Xanthomonadales bacterium]
MSAGWTFDRERIRVFRFLSARYDAESGIARLAYAFDDGPELVETLGFPDAPPVRDAARVAAALDLVHWIAGVSYYKAAIPRRIEFASRQPEPQALALLDQVYSDGLAEFAWRNGLDLRGHLSFAESDQPRSAGAAAATTVDSAQGDPALSPALPRRSLVAIGGGKDSLVSIELLRSHGEDMRLFWIGQSPLIAAVAARTGLPVLNISRRLAPELFEFNRLGAWNGHIPVTAINSAIGVLAAVLYGYDAVVFSNEHSASAATLETGGRSVNHQWSKGFAFEQAFAAVVQAAVSPQLDYFSLLRPFSELAVTARFADMTAYHQHFSSCNRNFRILGERPAGRWCGECPKCQFVFLALAPFLPKPALVRIFGRNLLDEPAQAAGFDALVEWQAHKPFECVGEADESRAAFAALAGRAEWREDALVKRWATHIAPQLPASAALATLLAPRPGHAVPERYQALINAMPDGRAPGLE